MRDMPKEKINVGQVQCPILSYYVYVSVSRKNDGTCKIRNKIEKKRNETKRNLSKRNKNKIIIIYNVSTVYVLFLNHMNIL